MRVAPAVTTMLVILAGTGTTAARGEIERLSWLAGCWNEAAEPGSCEHWTPLAGGIVLGTGRTLRKGKTAEFEFMQLRTLNDKSAVFENPAHDIPQRVIYARTPTGDLSARIEGTVDGKVQGIDCPG